MPKLAIFGGTPIRKEKIFYGRQFIDEDDIAAVSDTLRGPLITQGPRVEQLEKDLCTFTGAKHAVCLANGTAALHIACLVAGIKEGDEVITTPMTFAASANCILYCGGHPVFADINYNTYNISPKAIREKVTEKTKAVIAVDFTGQAVEFDEIRDICSKYNLVFIEDASHSIGTKYKNENIGFIADITTFSFHPVKTVTGGEGGAILTNSPEMYRRAVLFRTHGITKDAGSMEHESEGVWYYEQVELGFNYRITDIQAALICSQLKKIDRFVIRRKEIVKRYNDAFKKLPGIIIQKEIDESDSCRHLYIIQLDTDKLKCTRKEFFDAMSAENVQPQVHYIPIYYFPYYQKMGYKKGICPNAEKLYKRIMSIPLYPAMTDKDIDDTIIAVKKIHDYYYK